MQRRLQEAFDYAEVEMFCNPEDTMNRIYQGRVTKVEVQDGKGGWTLLGFTREEVEKLEKQRDELRTIAGEKSLAGERARKELSEIKYRLNQPWQETLWRLHENYQDAINYYLAAFAAMIPDDCNEEVWLDYRLSIKCSWTSYAGRKGIWQRPFGNVCKIIGCKEDASFEEFRSHLLSLSGSRATIQQKFSALKQLFEIAIESARKIGSPEQAIEESLQGKGRDLFGKMLVALCAQKTSVTPQHVQGQQQLRAYECVKKVTEGKVLKWADVFSFKTELSEADWTRQEAAKTIVNNLDDLIGELDVRAKKAKGDDQRKTFSDLAGRLRKQKKHLDAWCNNPKTKLPVKEPTRRGSGGYDFKAAMLFALKPELDGFRDVFLQLNQSRLKRGPVKVKKTDAVHSARMAGGTACRVFPFFCDLWTGRLNDDTVGQGVWPHFEKQAFVEVFTKISQFILQERKFELRLIKASQAIARIEEQKETDSRLQAVENIAAELANDAVDDYGCPRLYSIRDRTIKAWPKVRSAWRDLIDKRPDVTSDILIKEKNRLQERYRERFGSGALFDKLAENRDIWDHDDLDPLSVWADYVEAREEKEHLESERIFTPAHAVQSPRYFRWSETSNKEHYPLNSTGDPFKVEADAIDFDGKKKVKIVIHFTAPRLLRDSLRQSGERLDKEEPDQPWQHPVLRAFLKNNKWPSDKQTFAGTSVRLAPREKTDIQLVFEPELSVAILNQKWSEEMPFTPRKEKSRDGDEWIDAGLRWPKSESETLQWVEHGEIKCLAVDLGLTNSAAWHVFEATSKKMQLQTDRLRHQLNPDSSRPAWYASSLASGIVRVFGEDRWIYRKINDRDRKSGDRKIKDALKKAGAEATYAFLPELSGSAGRNVTSTREELDEAAQMFDKFKGKGFVIDEHYPDWRKKLSFPEQNDELLWGLKRVRAQLFRLNRLAEQFNAAPDSKFFKAGLKSIEKLRVDDPLSELNTLDNDVVKLRARISVLAEDYLDCLRSLLPKLSDRILPVRRGHWEWHTRADGWHEMLLDERRPRKDALLAGQRGISLARLNQLRDLRQLAQSLNHLCRHKPGTRFKMLLGENVPEPFEGCRQALEDARGDRAKQIAHEIFAIALGVELAAPPSDKRSRKQTESLHGVYRCLNRGPVNFIALENLASYRTSTKQSRRENRQLSTWAHRRIHKILSELCEMVGLPIVLVSPELTSRFSAKDHSAGFRAEEVRKNDPRMSFWRRKAHEEKNGWWAEFVPMLDVLPENRSLLLPKLGGEFFVSLKANSPLYNADLNAAYRIGLRALAHPSRAELIGKTWIKIKNKNKLYIVDTAGVLPGSVLRDGILTNSGGERVWDQVYGKLAWQRCRDINISRLKVWGLHFEEHHPAISSDDDEIPF